MQRQPDALTFPPCPRKTVDVSTLEQALVACWDHQTAYRGVTRPGNRAFGQCYPTARVMQWFYPEYEIAKGEVWTGSAIECHFWNARAGNDDAHQLDLSWQQFPAGSVVLNYTLLDRRQLDDSDATVKRCALLLQRVLSYLERP